MIKKLLAYTIVLLASTNVAMSAPAIKGIWKTVRLADGTQVRVQLQGDEHVSFWTDAKGNAYTENFGNNHFIQVDKKQLIKDARERKEAANNKRQTKQGMRKVAAGDYHQPYVGTKKGLVILAQYEDVKFENGHSRELYNNAINTPGFQSDYGHDGSVHDYFYDMSKGTFDLSFDVVGPITLQKKRKDYGQDVMNWQGQTTIDPYAYTMIMEACQAVDDQVNFADYDWDGDGEADQVVVIYAGHGENGIGGAESVWPHESELGYASTEDLTPLLELDGTMINTYACTSELTVYGLDESDNYITGLDGIGTLCHEFAHCLGLPDMYDTGDGLFYGMGTWDLMDQGSYNANAFLPASLTAYELRYIGWQEPIELTEDVTIDDMKAITEGGDTYIIYNDGYRDITYVDETGKQYYREEYYMLENRQPTKWDRGLYGNGLLITHVEFNPQMWLGNWVNWSGVSDIEGSVHQYCHVVCADNSYVGTYDFDGVYGEKDAYVGGIDIKGDTYPYEGNDSLTNTSWPYAKVYRPNTDGTGLLNKAITGIHRNDDGTVGFTFRAVDTNKEISDDHFRTGQVFFYESFNMCTGKGGNDAKWGPGAQVGNGKLAADNNEEGNTWDATGCYAANQCARIGTKAKSSSVLSPMFWTEGKAYVSFLAAPFSGDSNTLRVKIESYSFMGGGVEIPGQEYIEFELVPDQWNECRFPIFGDGDAYICFMPEQRVFIDEVLVRAPLPKDQTATGIASAMTTPVGNQQGFYNLNGQRIGEGYKGIAICNGRKVVVK